VISRRDKQTSQDDTRLSHTLTANLLKDHTMFIFIHANKAAGETMKSIAYHALATNHWDGAALGTRTGWQFMEQTMSLYDASKQAAKPRNSDTGKSSSTDHMSGMLTVVSVRSKATFYIFITIRRDEPWQDHAFCMWRAIFHV
jgi:hypothetical protein